MAVGRKIHSKFRGANVCPCCGHEVDKTKFIVDIPTGVVVFNNKIHAMAKRMAEIIAILWDAYPNGVTNDEIVYEIYSGAGKEEPECGNGSLSVAISVERPKLAEMGIEIIACHIDNIAGKRLKLTNLLEQSNIEKSEGRPLNLKRHGNYGYSKGCRCPTCVVMHQEYQRIYQRDYYRARVSITARKANGQIISSSQEPELEKTI